MDPISTGSTLLDFFVAMSTVMLGRKGLQLGVRQWGNGFSNRTEPITKDDMRDELRPIQEHQAEVLKELKEQSAEMRTHNGWMRGYLERGDRQ